MMVAMVLEVVYSGGGGGNVSNDSLCSCNCTCGSDDKLVVMVVVGPW